MDKELKALLVGKAIGWAGTQLGIPDTIAVIDENSPADVYGEKVLAWYIELLSPQSQYLTAVEVAIDPDGLVGAYRIEPGGPRLMHLWPR